MRELYDENRTSSNILGYFSVIVSMKLLLVLALTVFSLGMVIPIYAQLYQDQSSPSTSSNAQQNQVQLTDKGTIKVGFYTDPANPDTTNQTKFYISFLNKNSDMIQPHIDYKIFIKKGADQIFGIPVTHTAQGSVSIPFQFTDAGTYQVLVEVDGILFQPIPPETASFTVDVGSTAVPEFPFAQVVLVAGISSLIVMYRIKIRN
jgi:uncharacterized protein (UPF0333 family)